MLMYTSVLYKREKSANFRKHVSQIRSQNSSMPKKFGSICSFFQFVKFFPDFADKISTNCLMRWRE